MSIYPPLKKNISTYNSQVCIAKVYTSFGGVCTGVYITVSTCLQIVYTLVIDKLVKVYLFSNHLEFEICLTCILTKIEELLEDC